MSCHALTWKHKAMVVLLDNLKTGSSKVSEECDWFGGGGDGDIYSYLSL